MPDQQSLDDIEGTTWGDAPDDATTLVARVHELRHRPVADLSPADVRLLIGQAVGPDALLPTALGWLRLDPLTEAEFYPGDLLVAVLRLPVSYWREHVAAADEIASLVDSITELPAELTAAVASFRAVTDT